MRNTDNANCANCALYGKGCKGFNCLSYFKCETMVHKGEDAEKVAEGLEKLKANRNRPVIKK